MSPQFDLVYWSYCSKPPENGPNLIFQRKNQLLFPSKSENDKYPEAETWIQKIYMDGAIIGYVRVSDDCIVWPQGDNLKPIWGEEMFFSSLFYENYVIFLGPGTYLI